MTLSTRTTFTAALPQLDVYSLREDWALAAALENHWMLLAESLGLSPSRWIDTAGDRMYGAVIALSTRYDLDAPVLEDDAVTARTTIEAIEKPHAVSTTRFEVGGASRLEVRLLTSFIKRRQKGSNKRFSKVRDLWTAEDHDAGIVAEWLDRHHAAKSFEDAGAVALETEINRMRDFNTADFMYFKNYIRFAKAAEWCENRGRPVRLNARRDCFFFGNVDDGDLMETRVHRDGDRLQTTHHAPDGRRIFVSRAQTAPVTIAER